MADYLTPEEIDDLQTTTLHRRTPFAIYNVTQTQFSIARHYGGIDYNGSHYTYFPAHDELIRDDVLKHVTTRRKDAAKKQAIECQENLF